MSRTGSVTAAAVAIAALLAPATPVLGQETGAPEAGAPEAGAPEAGTPEAGTPDAGAPAAGGPEAGAAETGTAAPWPPRRGMMGMRGEGPPMMRQGYGRGEDGRAGRRGGGATMAHGAAMRVVFALMDADGDGEVSLEEWLEAHERIFIHMDREGDGQVSMEDMMGFMMGRGMMGRGFGTSPLAVEDDEDEDDDE
jgi:hypothetical protein